MLKNLSENISVIGLTGGIAAGKTAATAYLASLGFDVVDVDEISRAVTSPIGVAYPKLKSLFPEAVESGRLNRKKLRAAVFASEEKRKLLESVTHPLIFEETKKALAAARSPAVLSAPLLFETGMEKLCSVTVVITADTDIRIARLVKRDNITKELAQKMIDAQLSDKEKAKKADFVIDNSGADNVFFEKLNELCKKILKDC